MTDRQTDYIFSLIAITLGILLWRRGLRLIREGKTTKATVIKNVYKPDYEGQGFYYPVIEFTTDKNERIIKELNLGTNPAKPIGRIITILYDPKNPADAVTHPTLQLEIIPRLLVTLGATTLLIATLNLLGLISIIPH